MSMLATIDSLPHILISKAEEMRLTSDCHRGLAARAGGGCGASQRT